MEKGMQRETKRWRGVKDAKWNDKMTERAWDGQVENRGRQDKTRDARYQVG
jgi:hypothetical protein